ncbi:ABC transporter ATP-binding protein [Inquilinus limosus]|uniref:ABC transporter domain-containing protein n=1 Tax=Inquilinus limosus TaxID=171674 RepID=A0A211ZV93_9PROT|nr:ATP-binding cassette domain-containing protein [Inquilinus limosus]OWJ69185.1 hypothetical protein BWR60_01240 [Inquilinus limosus]
MVEIAIRFSDVTRIFPRPVRRPAVLGLQFAVERGDYVCILGRTGCGKSTTVNLLLGLDRPTSGKITVFGHDPARDFRALRGRIGCVFQSDRLLPWRTAVGNVRVPLEIIGPRGPEAPSAEECLAKVGLAGYEDAFPHELSGGMRQRVALARALVSDPDILVADEAFGHLDEVTAHTLRAAFKEIARETGKTVLQITHSIDEALALANRILVFGRPGHVAADFDVVDFAGAGGRSRLREAIRARIEDAETAEVRGMAI